MPLNFHPWRKLPKSARTRIGSVKVNLTIPAVITGYGGKGNFNLKYTCRHDMCVKISKFFFFSFAIIASYYLRSKFLASNQYSNICRAILISFYVWISIIHLEKNTVFCFEYLSFPIQYL